MFPRRAIILFIAAALFCISISMVLYASDEEAIASFNKSYKRTRSRVMMRVIPKPTLASLDFAAYDRNPLFHSPKAPEDELLKPTDLTFSNSLSNLADRVADTPLDAKDKSSPMAWSPMLDFLADWDYDESMELMIIGSDVSSEKWGNKSVTRPIQQITTAYIHNDQLWVKVEFGPYFKSLEGVDDEDKDGYPEIYGLIDKSKYSPMLLDYLKSEYLKKILTPEEAEDYFFDLSSDWYEAHRTETLDMEANRPWPNKETEPEIVKELGKISIASATAIIRGEPFGSPIYNVFLVRMNRGKGGPVSDVSDISLKNIAANMERLQGELQRWGKGSWEKWVGSISDFRSDIERQLKERPAEIKGFIGKDGFLFYRGSLEYLTSGELRQQKDGRDPYPAIVDYRDQLAAKGIDFLFVIIPTKAEIFPEKISDSAPDGAKPYVTPYTRKLMLDLAEAGVEVIDLLPDFIEARYDNDAPIYMKQDTHWTDRGLRLAAQIISDRIKQYPWFNDIRGEGIQYEIKAVDVTRGGDIRDMMLPDKEKIKYRPMKLIAKQVLNPDGSFYEDDKASPIVILGDSFCGEFQVKEPKHAGVSSHIAQEIGMPVDLIVAYGSGPDIRGRLTRRGSEAVSKKKLVVWTTAARDLYNYRSPWKIIRVP